MTIEEPLKKKVEMYKEKLRDICKNYLSKEEFEVLFSRAVRRALRGEFGPIPPEVGIPVIPYDFYWILFFESRDLLGTETFDRLLESDIFEVLYKEIERSFKLE